MRSSDIHSLWDPRYRQPEVFSLWGLFRCCWGSRTGALRWHMFVRGNQQTLAFGALTRWACNVQVALAGLTMCTFDSNLCQCVGAREVLRNLCGDLDLCRRCILVSPRACEPSSDLKCINVRGLGYHRLPPASSTCVFHLVNSPLFRRVVKSVQQVGNAQQSVQAEPWVPALSDDRPKGRSNGHRVNRLVTENVALDFVGPSPNPRSLLS